MRETVRLAKKHKVKVGAHPSLPDLQGFGRRAMMLQLTPKSDQLNRLSTYYAAQLLAKEWMQPVNEPHEMFPVTIKETKNGERALPALTAYAVRRPDHQWALLAINKDPKRAAELNVQFKISGEQETVSFGGQVEVIQFSRAQYAWHGPEPTRAGRRATDTI